MGNLDSTTIHTTCKPQRRPSSDSVPKNQDLENLNNAGAHSVRSEPQNKVSLNLQMKEDISEKEAS